MKSAAQGAVLLNFNGEMHNEGLVNFLLSGSNNVNASLILSEGSTLVNEADGEILMGSGTGTSILQGTVDNFGTINILEDNSKINGVGTVLNNHGTVNVASTGRLFGENATYNQIAGVFNNERDVRLENNGTFNMSGGVLNENSAGSEIFHVKNLIISGGDHNGRAIVVTNGTAHFAAEAPNDANVQLRQSNTVSGVVAEGQTVRVLKQPNLSSTTTFAPGFVNNGLLLLNRSSTTDTSFSTAKGSIVNTATGVIQVDNKVNFDNIDIVNEGLVDINADSAHRFGGTFTNTGNINVDAAAQWTQGVSTSMVHNGGLITNDGDFHVSGQLTINGDIVNNGSLDVLVSGSNPPGVLLFQSGTVTGNSIVIDGGRLDIQGTDVNTFIVQSNLSTSVIAGNLAAGQMVIARTKGTTPPLLKIADGTIINGTLIIDTTGAGGLGRLESTAGGPIVIGPTGRLVFEGAVRDLTIFSDIINLGTIDSNGRPRIIQMHLLLRSLQQHLPLDVLVDYPLPQYHLLVAVWLGAAEPMLGKYLQ
ncbi:MAG: hypothetical protein R3B84_13885 [Zavarzinella sp.]